MRSRVEKSSSPLADRNSPCCPNLSAGASADLLAEAQLLPDVNEGHLLRRCHHHGSVHLGTREILHYGYVLVGGTRGCIDDLRGVWMSSWEV